MDGLTLLYALLGGAFNGTFPVFIKTDAVLAANIHPTVFQMAKSVWVCIFGIALVCIRAAREQTPVFAFTPWALASAAAWIPSGLTTIVAVPLIGVGSAVLTTSASGSVLSFLVFWLGFHENIKEHSLGGTTFYLAPVYMAGLCLGMAGRVPEPPARAACGL